MRFASATGAKFNQIIVLLSERHKAKQIVEFLLLGQFIRLITSGAKQKVDPLIAGKESACFLDIVQIQIRHLNRLER